MRHFIRLMACVYNNLYKSLMKQCWA